jgi:hypothetical protein
MNKISTSYNPFFIDKQIYRDSIDSIMRHGGMTHAERPCYPSFFIIMVFHILIFGLFGNIFFMLVFSDILCYPDDHEIIIVDPFLQSFEKRNIDGARFTIPGKKIKKNDLSL